MVAKSNVVVSEGQVTFKRVEGHKHDGLTSTLIDTSKYSMFDFIASETRLTPKQTNNRDVLKKFIVSTIEGRVLNPEGIRIQANAISAREIIAGTITANELSSNIVLINNVIKSSNYVNNTTTYTGWAIFSNGTANFNNVNIRGNLATGAGVYAAANTPLYADIVGQFSLGNKFIWNTTSNSLTINAGSLTLGSNLTWNGSTLTIRGALQFADGSTPGTFDNGDSLTDGYIGGIDINSTAIQSTNFVSGYGGSGFQIKADGNAEFNNVTVRGTIEASGGSIGGWDLDGYSLTAGTYGANGTNTQYSTLNGDGDIISYNYNSNFGLGEYWTYIDLNKTNPGLTVTGTASGGTYSSIVASSYMSTGTLFLNGTSVATSLAGKSNTGHTHAYSADDHLHDTRYVNVTGDTMTGILYGTGIDLSGNIRLAGQIYTDNTDNYLLFGKRTTTEIPCMKLNQDTTLYNKVGADGRVVRVNNNNVLYAEGASSIRYKEDIYDANIDAKTVLKLRVVNFKYKKDYLGDQEQTIQHGLIAEEVADLGLSPLIIYDDNNEPNAVHYDKIPLFLIKVAQEQQLKIEELEARIQALEGV